MDYFTSKRETIAALALWVLMTSFGLAADDGSHLTWKRHVIDDSSHGADGTRLADVNGDGLPDIATGWEQGGISRVCFHPGYEQVHRLWPAVTVGEAKDVEDAMFVDLDADGAMDVVSCCEGGEQALIVHWGSNRKLLESDSWFTTKVKPSAGICRWMFAIPMDVNGDGQVDVVAGGKGQDSYLGWWELPGNPREVSRWSWHPLRKVNWLMSLDVVDMNDDGKDDLLFTDRKGPLSGVSWLEHPERNQVGNLSAWREHRVGGANREVMFLSRGDLDGDQTDEIVVAVRPYSILILKRTDSIGSNGQAHESAERWVERELAIPEAYGTAKATAVADFNLDGKMQIAFSTERATDPKMAIGLLSPAGEGLQDWTVQSISGRDGVKHDLLVPVDLDGDGDLDLLTCEEVKNLGVIWYENPKVGSGH